MFVQPKRVERKDRKPVVVPVQPTPIDADTRIRELDQLNTNLAAALLVGLAKARNETAQLKRTMERQKAECDAADAVDANSKLRELVDKYFALNSKLLQRSDEQKRKISLLETERQSLKGKLDIVQQQLTHSNAMLADVSAKYDSECKRNSCLTKRAGDLEARLQQQQELQVQQEELNQHTVRLYERERCNSVESWDATTCWVTLAETAMSPPPVMTTITPPPSPKPSQQVVQQHQVISSPSSPPSTHLEPKQSCLWTERVLWLVICFSILLVHVLKGTW